VIYGINLACYNAFPARVSDIFSSISYPFAFSSYLLFTLYWHEMMTTSSVIVHPFIVKMRIPFFVICAALLSLDIVRIIMMYTAYWEGMSFLNCKYLSMHIRIRKFEHNRQNVLKFFSQEQFSALSASRYFLAH
jgi:hypothetical protein